MIYPTMPILPWKIDTNKKNDGKINHNGKKVSYLEKEYQNCELASNANYPCISLPSKRIKGGLSVNMEICAQTHNDSRLISIC